MALNEETGDERTEASMKEWDQNTGSGRNIKDGIRMLGKIMLHACGMGIIKFISHSNFSSAETETLGGGCK